MKARPIIESPDSLEVIAEENPGLNGRPPHTHPQAIVNCSDEELCRNAQQGCTASKEMLWHRYRDHIKRIVYRENKRQFLPHHEIADALQELYFAFHNTVRRYDPEKHCSRGKPAMFKTFLCLVVTHQFSNYCASWRMYHRRVVLNFDDKTSPCLTVAAVNERGRSFPPCEDLFPSELFPDNLVHLAYLPKIIKKYGDRLKPKERQLLEVWLQCGRDKAVAQILGISPAAAKLRRERLFHRIKQRVARK